ncbi:DUF1741 family protein [Schizosaccharomyces japonicus yFS275]|uniref:DUF1741 family protein n=1 Tax=Schizosaccharomyces japonicus (strain yFS275 / FY16936) TaxID=402676 RepID=B6K0E1_SCHJY|nr:DUF1741 family protein [Schizosaccharomyces japonicus yFS275]EEB06291.1 DUF1741 family protein [Schizosaccharomyces japonicus yFS275]
MNKANSVDTTPKIVTLYKQVLNPQTSADEFDDLFWREFFLLQDHVEELRTLLSEFNDNDVYHLRHKLRSMFSCVIVLLSQPSEERRVINAFKTLSVVFQDLSARKVPDFSLTVISFFGGIDKIDESFSRFVFNLGSLVLKKMNTDFGVQALLFLRKTVFFLYPTTLISHVFDDDTVFRALYSIVEAKAEGIDIAVTTLGLLSACDRFEVMNTCRVKLSHVTDEGFMTNYLLSVSKAMSSLCDTYREIKPEVSNTSGFFSFLSFSRTVYPPTEEQETAFSALPDDRTLYVIALYEMATCNKVFLLLLFDMRPSDTESCPLSNLISLASYIGAHQRSSPIAGRVSVVFLNLLHFMTDKTFFVNNLLNEDMSISPTLCSQRLPTLTFPSAPAPPLVFMLDVVVISLQHNLKRNLNCIMYNLSFSYIRHAIFLLFDEGLRLHYHWKELWRTLFFCLHFFASLYRTEVSPSAVVNETVDIFFGLLGFVISESGSVVETTEELVDLLYKLVHGTTAIRTLLEKRDWKNKSCMELLLKLSDDLTGGAPSGEIVVTDDLLSVIQKHTESLQIPSDLKNIHEVIFTERNSKSMYKILCRELADTALGTKDMAYEHEK